RPSTGSTSGSAGTARSRAAGSWSATASPPPPASRPSSRASPSRPEENHRVRRKTPDVWPRELRQRTGDQREPVCRKRVRNDQDAVVGTMVGEALQGETNEVISIAGDETAPVASGTDLGLHEPVVRLAEPSLVSPQAQVGGNDLPDVEPGPRNRCPASARPGREGDPGTTPEADRLLEELVGGR